jgi:hypothetical protein
MERADDILILERARIDGSICVTLDHDFHAHLALAGDGRPSVILLRVEGLDAQAQANAENGKRGLSIGTYIERSGNSTRTRFETINFDNRRSSGDFVRLRAATTSLRQRPQLFAAMAKQWADALSTAFHLPAQCI